MNDNLEKEFKIGIAQAATTKRMLPDCIILMLFAKSDFTKEESAVSSQNIFLETRILMILFRCMVTNGWFKQWRIEIHWSESSSLYVTE